MSDDELRAKLTGALHDGVEYGEFHVTYFTRTHAKWITDALMPVVREALADARVKALNGVAQELADCENDCAGLLAERADQWRAES